jgi:hypothetical protein
MWIHLIWLNWILNWFKILLKEESSFFLKLYLYGYFKEFRSPYHLEKVNGEIALIMTVYNLKRALNLLGIQHLIAKLSIRK